MSVDTRVPGVATETGPVAAPTAPARRGRRRESWVARLIPPLVTFGIFLGVWYLISLVVLDPDRRFLLPPPDAVLEKSFGDVGTRTDILAALGLSAWIAAAGFAISVVLGMALGIAMSQARWVERSLYPYAVLLHCIPVLALVPVIGFWFEFGYLSRLIVTVLISIFPVITTTLFGLRAAERGQHELFTLHHAGRLTRLRKLQLPAALPTILTGFQMSATLAVVGSVVGDFFFKQGDPGIGVLLDLYRSRIQSEEMFGAAIAASLLGLAAFSIFGLISRVATGGWYGTNAYDRAA